MWSPYLFEMVSLTWCHPSASPLHAQGAGSDGRPTEMMYAPHLPLVRHDGDIEAAVGGVQHRNDTDDDDDGHALSANHDLKQVPCRRTGDASQLPHQATHAVSRDACRPPAGRLTGVKAASRKACKAQGTLAVDEPASSATQQLAHVRREQLHRQKERARLHTYGSVLGGHGDAHVEQHEQRHPHLDHPPIALHMHRAINMGQAAVSQSCNDDNKDKMVRVFTQTSQTVLPLMSHKVPGK